jgi:hypothetical protein
MVWFQVAEALLSQTSLDKSALSPAILEVKGAEFPSPGSVFAVGLARSSLLNEKLRSLLASVPPDSDLALACVVSLGLCLDDSTEAITLVVQQLGIEKHRYQAKIALRRIGNQASLDALLADLRSQFDLSVAIDLYQRPDSSGQALEIITSYLAPLLTYQMVDVLDRILDLSEDLVAPLLEDVRVRDFLRERSFADERHGWSIGSKATAIRGLARFDRYAAQLAAIKSLQNEKSHDRGQFPCLVIELAGEQAVEMLVEQACVEKSTLVIWSIARALDNQDYTGALSETLRSADPARRQAGCSLAEKLRLPITMISKLDALAEDPDNAVVTAACRAFSSQRAFQDSDALMKAVLDESDSIRRWILIDALLTIADPGDAHRRFPGWVSDIFGSSAYLEQEYVTKKLGERRDEIEKEAVELDRKRYAQD